MRLNTRDIDCQHPQCHWQMDVTEVDQDDGFAIRLHLNAILPNASSPLRQQLTFTIDELWLTGPAFDAFSQMLSSQAVAELYDMSLNLVARLTQTNDACTLELNPTATAATANSTAVNQTTAPLTVTLTLTPDFYLQLGRTLQQFAKWW